MGATWNRVLSSRYQLDLIPLSRARERGGMGVMRDLIWS